MAAIPAQRRPAQRLVPSPGSYFLIWGTVYVLVPLISLYLRHQAVWLANGLVVLGVLATILVGRSSPVRSSLGFRMGVFWWVVFAFAAVWLIMLGGEGFPHVRIEVDARQTWAFGISIAMMVFVLMGLIIRYPLLTVLGISVTALTLTAFFVAWEWGAFWPWVAVCSGGPLLVAGSWCKRQRNDKETTGGQGS